MKNAKLLLVILLTKCICLVHMSSEDSLFMRYFHITKLYVVISPMLIKADIETRQFM